MLGPYFILRFLYLRCEVALLRGEEIEAALTTTNNLLDGEVVLWSVQLLLDELRVILHFLN